MTGPVTTEALVEALAPALWQIRIGLPGGLPANSWEETLRAAKALPGGQAAWDVARIKGEASAILAGPLAPLFAALQQVTAERDGYRETHRWNIDRTGDGEVLVCRGYHDKGEDCDHERFVPEERLATATSELARLRAEGEAKDRRIATLTEALAPFARFGDMATPDTAETWAGVHHTFRIGTRFKHEHFRAARAATAREGQADA